MKTHVMQSPHPAATRLLRRCLLAGGHCKRVASGVRGIIGHCIFVLIASFWPGVALAATPVGKPASVVVAIATILDGDAILLRDTSQFTLAEGTRLYADDILETGANSRLLQLEFTDGTRLSLGPATRLQIMPQLGAARAKTATHAYLLQGSLKLRTGTDAASTARAVLASPLLDLQAGSANASAVLLVQASGSRLFAETGDVTLVSWRAVAPASNALKTGEFLNVSANAKPLLASRPPGDFIQSLPKAFLDNLPARAALFGATSNQVSLTRAGEPAYALVQPWLDAEPALRKANLSRWKPLAAKPEFRQALRANMGAHPEWRPVLDPPQPKVPASGASPGNGAVPLQPATTPLIPTTPRKTP